MAETIDLIRSFGSHAIVATDKLEHGNLQYSINVGGQGLYFIVNLVDAYWLVISYQTVGIQSFDAVVDGIGNFQLILNAIYQ